MKNRIKKLTPQKIKRISAIITTIMVLGYIFIGVSLKPISIYSLLLILPAFVLGSAVAVLIYYLLLHLAGLGDYKEKEEVSVLLSKDKYTELSFFLDVGSYEAKILSDILKAEGCKFYAKLIEDDNINLVVIDKNNNKIHDSIIPTYFYFKTHFKPKEEL